MRRQMLGLILMGTGAVSLPAAAHECSNGIARPYVIEKTCDDDNGSCTVRMQYAPGEHPGLAGYGSYWYPRAKRYVQISPLDTLPDCYSEPQGRKPHINEDSKGSLAKQV